MPITYCRHFNGYKPCLKNSHCDDSCPSKSIPSVKIVMIHLGAIGAVVRSTALLKGIHQKYPGCSLTWVTDRPSDQLLRGHPLIDRVYTTLESDLLELASLNFDIALVVDKSFKAAGVLRRIHVDMVFGFQVDPEAHCIVPANQGAVELWELGLDDQKKFYQNTKSELELTWNALELGPYRRDSYFLHLATEEKSEIIHRNKQWKKNLNQPIIGFNTGCSPTIPYKKWTIEFHRKVIQDLLKQGMTNIVLLGGPEDQERNIAIGKSLPVILSPTQNGLRDGLVSVGACDLVVSGDSLGMHMAIALQKFVIAWFGPTCEQEIDLFDRGIKLASSAPCAPCWKRICTKTNMCYDQIDIEKVRSAIATGVQACHKQQIEKSWSFKPPF